MIELSELIVVGELGVRYWDIITTNDVIVGWYLLKETTQPETHNSASRQMCLPDIGSYCKYLNSKYYSQSRRYERITTCRFVGYGD